MPRCSSSNLNCRFFDEVALSEHLLRLFRDEEFREEVFREESTEVWPGVDRTFGRGSTGRLAGGRPEVWPGVPPDVWPGVPLEDSPGVGGENPDGILTKYIDGSRNPLSGRLYTNHPLSTARFRTARNFLSETPSAFSNAEFQNPTGRLHPTTSSCVTTIESNVYTCTPSWAATSAEIILRWKSTMNNFGRLGYSSGCRPSLPLLGATPLRFARSVVCKIKPPKRRR